MYVQRGADLDNPTVCVSSGTTLEKEVADFFGNHHKQYKLLSFEHPNERDQAYVAGRCDALVNGFVQPRLLNTQPEHNLILPEVLCNTNRPKD
jgi:general L-amino acid transport system substrate-binding protein